jgi:hypothetical protein
MMPSTLKAARRSPAMARKIGWKMDGSVEWWRWRSTIIDPCISSFSRFYPPGPALPLHEATAG